MASNTATGIVPEASGRPFLCGALWGLGLGLLIASTVYLRTTSALIMVAILFVVGPAICLASVVAIGVSYRRLARTRPHISSPRFQIAAAAGAIVLASLPWVVETSSLYSFAYLDIPVYPQARRLDTTIVQHYPAAKVSVTFSSNAPTREILEFYDREFRARKWSTDLNPSVSVSAQKANSILFVYVRESQREIGVQWYRNFTTH